MFGGIPLLGKRDGVGDNDALTVAQVIQKSSNIGTAKIAAMLSPEQMWNMFDAIGLGQQPGLGFPGEVTGRLRPWKGWRPIEQATMSYGHGISVSLNREVSRLSSPASKPESSILPR